LPRPSVALGARNDTQNIMSTYKSYITGFILSIALTLAAYFAVQQHALSNHIIYSHKFLIPFILVLAVVQLLVQLIFFLHIGRGSDRGWNLAALISTISIILILVIGSLWIMNHLNYNMTPSQMDKDIIKSEGMMK
jgi:cytochrome o ubiquinol oxidase operon protein cyoD